jgi:hypothetical protein
MKVIPERYRCDNTHERYLVTMHMNGFLWQYLWTISCDNTHERYLVTIHMNGILWQYTWTVSCDNTHERKVYNLRVLDEGYSRKIPFMGIVTRYRSCVLSQDTVHTIPMNDFLWQYPWTVSCDNTHERYLVTIHMNGILWQYPWTKSL